jgi:hypothetical protein
MITTGLAQPDLVLAAGALRPGGSYTFWLEARDVATDLTLGAASSGELRLVRVRVRVS